MSEYFQTDGQKKRIKGAQAPLCPKKKDVKKFPL